MHSLSPKADHLKVYAVVPRLWRREEVWKAGHPFVLKVCCETNSGKAVWTKGHFLNASGDVKPTELSPFLGLKLQNPTKPETSFHVNFWNGVRARNVSECDLFSTTVG